MKKIIKLIIAIGILLFFKVLLSFTINEISISNYRKENYDTSLLQILYFLNINEPYIAYYNHGNILYQQEKYEDAIEKYTMALEKNPPKKRVCNIQINLVLAHVKTIDFQKKETALKQLKNARQILYNHHCADPNDLSGDSKESEELEEELKKIEKEMGGEEEDPNGGSGNKKEENETPENKKEKEAEEKLKEQRKEANGSRQETIEQYKNETEYGYFGKRW